MAKKKPRDFDQTFEMMPVGAIQTHPDNPRVGNVEDIIESIQRNGWYGTILVQKSSGYIIAGNHRYKAAVEMGMESVPVMLHDCDDTAARRIMLADNRIGDQATYDNASLLALLQTASEDDGLAGTGYDGDYMMELAQNLAPADLGEMAAAFGAVPAGESEFATMTFTIPTEDKATVDEALAQAKSVMGDVDGNVNGIALVTICRYMLTGEH